MACEMSIFTSPFSWNGSRFFICLASAVFGSRSDLLEENFGFSVCFSSWRCCRSFGLICPIQVHAFRTGRCFRSSFFWPHFSWPGFPNDPRCDPGLQSDSRGETAVTPWRQENFNHRLHRFHGFEEKGFRGSGHTPLLTPARGFHVTVQESRQATFPSRLQICVIREICG